MDYEKMAEELMELRGLLRSIPLSQELSCFDRGMTFALHYLMIHGYAVHPKELQRAMGVSSARVTVLFNHLEKEGLITRSPDSQDNRQVLVALTSAGEQAIHEKQAHILKLVAKTLEGLGPEDAQALLRIQRKLVEQLFRQGAVEDGKEGPSTA